MRTRGAVPTTDVEIVVSGRFEFSSACGATGAATGDATNGVVGFDMAACVGTPATTGADAASPVRASGVPSAGLPCEPGEVGGGKKVQGGGAGHDGQN